ncbi:hypothetical protein KJ641_02485 [Patescibacteria group bacterium]|nr:hypothetical protein [Patescibacteria group bacterium]
MKLNFVIDEDYFVAHTLCSMGAKDFSSSKRKKDIVAFQNFAWGESESHYNFLVARFSSEIFIQEKADDLFRKLPKYLRVLKQSKFYKTILEQTVKYLNFCEKQWDDNYPLSSKVIKKLTDFKLNKEFTIYITHPGLRNGVCLKDDKIAWGHHEDWSNYATVYLWHEILHSYFEYTDLDHALIQLIADEELRIKLNGGKYPPFVGHKDLFPLMRIILPNWKKYLKSNSNDIMQLKRELSDLETLAKHKSSHFQGRSPGRALS